MGLLKKRIVLFDTLLVDQHPDNKPKKEEADKKEEGVKDGGDSKEEQTGNDARAQTASDELLADNTRAGGISAGTHCLSFFSLFEFTFLKRSHYESE